MIRKECNKLKFPRLNTCRCRIQDEIKPNMLLLKDMGSYTEINDKRNMSLGAYGMSVHCRSCNSCILYDRVLLFFYTELRFIGSILMK